MSNVVVPPGAFYARPVEEVRSDMRKALIAHGYEPRDVLTVGQAALCLAHDGVNFRKIWYRLPEEILAYEHEALR